jgi:hypothetical protein
LGLHAGDYEHRAADRIQKICSAVTPVSPAMADRRSPRRRPIAGGARWLAAGLVLAAGAMHLWLYFDFFHRIHVVGELFLVNAAFGIVGGIVLLRTGRAGALAAGGAYSAETLAGFLWSVYHGLFGYVESLRGPWQEAAGGVEVAALVILVPLFVRTLLHRRERVPENQRRSGLVGLAKRRADREGKRWAHS